MTARAGVFLDPGPFSDNTLSLRGVSVTGLGINDATGVEDLLEHQQAKQQAQFSEKFHQLKQWQEEQKEKLVQAQQEKMQLLRVQQEQLQRVLAEQRNKQWGGSASSPSMEQSPTSHYAESPSFDSSSPAKRGQGSLLQRYDSSSLGNLLQQAQDDILEEEEDGSDLENAGSVKEDGFYPLPDTTSELSDGDGQYFEIEELNPPTSSEDFHHPHLPLRQEPTSSFGMNHMMQSDELPPSMSSPLYHQHAPSPRDSSDRQLASGMDQDGATSMHFGGDEYTEAGQHDKETSPSLADGEDDGDDGDRPIKSTMSSSLKSFEELLEEKLLLESGPEQVPQQRISGKPKHTFLKRGEGLARFGKMKVPSPRTKKKKKQEGSLKLKKNGIDSFEGRNENEGSQFQNAAPLGNLNGNNVSKAIDGNDVFKKPTGRAPVSVRKERLLPSRGNSAHRGTEAGSISPSVQSDAKDGEMDKSIGMVRWEKKIELEEEDLAEFEMLEQAADDNASFSSENSLVVGVMHRAKLRGKMFVASPLSKTRLSTLHSVDAAEDAKEESGDQSGDDRMSLEHAQEDVLDSPSSDRSSNGSDLNETLKEETEGDRRPTAKRKVTKGRSMNSHSKAVSDRPLTIEQKRTEFEEYLRKGEGGISSSGFAGHSYEQSVESDEDDGEEEMERGEEEEGDSDRSIDGLVTVIPNRLQSMLVSARSSQDKQRMADRPLVEEEEEEEKVKDSHGMGRDYQQTGTFLNIEKVENNGRFGGVVSFKGNKEDVEEEEHEGSSKEQAGAAGYEFEDDETWGDFSENLSDSSSDSIIAGGPTMTSTPPSKKVNNGKSKSVLDVARGSIEQPEEQMGSTPPPSHLVAKLFPQLKPKEKTKPAQPGAMESLQSTRDRPVGEGLQAKVFTQKLAELENEIARFRKENAALSRLREEREKGLELFKKEVTEFERQKEAELKKIEEYRNKEMKKLKKEKKIFEKHQKATRSLPDKKDREEIDQLKNQLSEVQEELSRRESRWTANSKRLKDRVEALSNENESLKEEIEARNIKQQEDLAKGERKKAAARIRALRTAGKPKSLIPEFEPGKFPTLPSNLPRALDTGKTTVKQHDKKTLPVEKVKEPPGHKKDMSDSDSSSSDDDPSPAPSPQGGTDHHPAVSPSGFRDQEAFKSPQMTPERDGDHTEEQIHHPDGKVEVLHPDGSRLITFKNGTRKEISSDGQIITVTFFNGDTRQIYPDQRVVYYYAETQITHTTYPDGLEIIHFPNNQTEKHYPDGTKEITFPDQTIKYLFQNGGEECVFPDGTLLRVAPDGDRTMEFPNGQREIHTAHCKKREYPDGTVKTIYPDGKQETRYAHGRIRVKDKDGRVLVDQQT
ncbi:uncharacterized protein [Apostichopus japonicus]|uniref:uncharacterized protein isoform X2 n=1 Tax=Stichopus japonicus TaxID=307972 RepID=UPI003AB13952